MILHQHIKNYDYMMFGCWVIDWTKRQVVLGQCLPFYPPRGGSTIKLLEQKNV